MRLIPVFLLLSACACVPRNGTLSPCGSDLQHNTGDVTRAPYASASETAQYVWTDEDLAYAETRTLKFFARLKIPGFMDEKQLCERLRSVSIIQQPYPVWVDDWDRQVSGLTYCFQSRVYIGTGVFGINAYTHEIAHIAQGCNSPLPVDEHSDADHSNWIRDGIYDTIADAMDPRVDVP